ncbi:MAG: hypothetical protein HY819_08885 [Acidobacteria bacterium]|nr:hypothetical protein [Acidobacteriota bacterium]
MSKIIKVIVVCLLVSMLACQKPTVNLLTEEIFTTTAKKQVEIAKQKAETLKLATTFKNVDASSIIFPQEDGNAGEIYWQVFKKFVGNQSADQQALLGQMRAVAEALDTEFKAAENAKITPQLLELVKTEAQKLSEIADLAELEKGAKRKTMVLVGESIAISENPRSIKPLSPEVIRGYAIALICKGLLKESAGDKAAAETALQTAVALGQHFAQDANYFHYLNGMGVMLSSSLTIKQFYERSGNKEKQSAAEKIEKETNEQLTQVYQLGAVDSDKQAFNILDGLGFLDDGVATLASFASSETVPAGLRAKAVESLFSGYVFRYLMAARSGKPAETTEYAPPSDARIQALAQVASSSNKALAQMGSNTKQILEKMKGQTSAERANYWKGISEKS